MKASATSSRTTTRSFPARRDSTPPRPDRFRLLGPTAPLDPRVHAYRCDIADVALAGQLFAPHYAAPEPRSAARRTMLLDAPDAGARAASELLEGEPFWLLDTSGGWSWGCTGLDGYVGYVPGDALAPARTPDHVVSARSALRFAEPSIKAPVLATIPMGTRLVGVARDGFLFDGVGYLHSRHVRALAEADGDAVGVAERLLGTPYLWGGRSGAGLDCSGLVQLALQLAGHADVPRDSDQQRETLGTPLPLVAPPARGDLVFFPGHVGLMADETRLIHANAHWMSVTVEPLDDVVARLAPEHAEPILARRRIV